MPVCLRNSIHGIYSSVACRLIRTVICDVAVHRRRLHYNWWYQLTNAGGLFVVFGLEREQRRQTQRGSVNVAENTWKLISPPPNPPLNSTTINLVCVAAPVSVRSGDRPVAVLCTGIGYIKTLCLVCPCGFWL